MKPACMVVALVWSSGVWAGEIVLSAPKGDAPASVSGEKDASRQRDSARDYRKGHVPDAPVVIVVPDEEDGMLSPRRGSSSSAAENSARARANRQNESVSGSNTPLILSPDVAPSGSKVESSTQRARDNRNRAAEYRTGESKSDRHIAVVGKDGLPVIDCSATENVSGRIGDDTSSGSVIILIKDRNQIKVRCR